MTISRASTAPVNVPARTLGACGGFSLLELIAASALGVMLLGMVAYTLNNASKAVNTTTTQVALHHRGRAIMDRMMHDLEAINPLYDADGSGNPVYHNKSGSGEENLIFLMSIPDLDTDGDGTDNYPTDLVYVWYRFDPAGKGKLERKEGYANPTDPLTLSSATGGPYTVFDRSINTTGSTNFFNYNAADNTVTVTFTITNGETDTSKSLSFFVRLPGN
jgi:type II secretory pathway pseudopilin PulG